MGICKDNGGTNGKANGKSMEAPVDIQGLGLVPAKALGGGS